MIHPMFFRYFPRGFHTAAASRHYHKRLCVHLFSNSITLLWPCVCAFKTGMVTHTRNVHCVPSCSQKWKIEISKVNSFLLPAEYKKYFGSFSDDMCNRNYISFMQKVYFSSTKTCPRRRKHYPEESDSADDNESDDNTDEKEYESLVRQWMHVSQMDHQLFVIQPYIKWGPTKKFNTTPELQLDEAVALVHTLPKWKVVDKITIALKCFEKKTVFGSGNFEMLTHKIRKDKRITAVFISLQMLHGLQHRELEAAFGVPVYDRYMLVMQIFREHAVTREAKLQVSMAEIPYLWSRIKVHAGATDRQGGGVASIGGAGETYIETHRRLLNKREIKLKEMLKKLRTHREVIRRKRKKLEYPVVAVVGYTNAGKTSLIQTLTGDTRMQPKNELFATLDVTVHLGVLPCQLKVLYVDTIGFISDIPTNLIESFVATLEDAMLADVILHVQDISHPDMTSQAANVMATLQGLKLSEHLRQNIVVVGNKADLVGEEKLNRGEDWVAVSALKGTGLDELKEKIENAVLKSTGRIPMTIRVPMGGEEERWLYKETAVVSAVADPANSQYLLMTVVISQVQFQKFRSYFVS